MQLEHFKACELVPASVYKDRGERSLQLMDKELLVFIDRLREELGRRITINNWYWGGAFSQRGLRTPDSDVYSRYSQHTYGKAIDFDVEGMDAGQVRQWIIDNRHLEWVRPISFIEDGVNWVHVDTRPIDNDQLWVWHVKTNKTKVYER